MTASTITADECKKLAQSLRDAADGNLLVGSFAAEILGESYPFSKAQCKIVFDSYEDEALGRKFIEWCGRSEPA